MREDFEWYKDNLDQIYKEFGASILVKRPDKKEGSRTPSGFLLNIARRKVHISYQDTKDDNREGNEKRSPQVL